MTSLQDRGHEENDQLIVEDTSSNPAHDLSLSTVYVSF